MPYLTERAYRNNIPKQRKLLQEIRKMHLSLIQRGVFKSLVAIHGSKQAARDFYRPEPIDPEYIRILRLMRAARRKKNTKTISTNSKKHGIRVRTMRTRRTTTVST